MDALKRNRRGAALALAAIGAFSAQFAAAAPKKVPAPQQQQQQQTKQAAQHKPADHAVKHPAVRVVRNVPLPHKRPPLPAASAPVPKLAAAAIIPGSLAFRKLPLASPAMFHPAERPPSSQFAVAPAIATSPDDIAAVKRVIEAAAQGQASPTPTPPRTTSAIRSRASSPNGSSCAATTPTRALRATPLS